MGGLECVITGLMDEFKDYFIRWNITREIFTGIIVVVSFIVALCCVTPVSYAQWAIFGSLKKPHIFREDFMSLLCLKPMWLEFHYY